MKEKHLGVRFLIEVGMSLVEAFFPNIESNVYDQLAKVLESFLRGNTTFDVAKQFYLHVLGRADPIQHIKEIIQLTDDPIPPNDNEYSETEEDSHMRKKRSTWTNYEDQRLIAGIYRYGLDNWPLVADFVGNNRTRAQCAQRWSRGLNPRICKKHWSPEEDAQLISLVKKYGEKSWTKIAQCLGNRSDVQCRYHYRQISRDGATTPEAPEHPPQTQNLTSTSAEPHSVQLQTPQVETPIYIPYQTTIAMMPNYNTVYNPVQVPQNFARIPEQKLAKADNRIVSPNLPLAVANVPLLTTPNAIPLIAAPHSDQVGYLDHFLTHFQ